MTVTLDSEAGRLLQRQLQAGAFGTAEEALKAAVRQVFGQDATPELGALPDDALDHSGHRIPLGEVAVVI